MGKDSDKKDLPKKEDSKVLSRPHRGYRYNDVRPEAPEAAMQHLAEAP